MQYYGVSTGSTGQHGIGDIVTGSSWSYEENGGGYLVDGEPCYNVFTVKNGNVEYVDLPTELTAGFHNLIRINPEDAVEQPGREVVIEICYATPEEMEEIVKWFNEHGCGSDYSYKYEQQ